MQYYIERLKTYSCVGRVKGDRKTEGMCKWLTGWMEVLIAITNSDTTPQKASVIFCWWLKK